MSSKTGKIDEFFDFEALQKEVEKVQKTLDGLSKTALNIAVGGQSVKGATNISQQKTDQDALNKLYATQAKQLTDLAKEEAKVKEQIRQKNAAIKEEINLNATVVGGYKAASTELQKRIRGYKDMVMSGKANTQSAKDELAAIQKLDANLKELDKTVGQHQKNVGNYQSAWNGLKNSWVAGIAVIAGVGAALAGVGKFISNVASATGDLSDRWTEMTTSAAFGWESLLTTIATGDFSNLINNMQKAIAAGKEYAQMLDEVEDRTRTITIAEKDMTLAVDALRLQLKNVNLTDEERLAIVTKIDNYEKGIAVEKKKTAQIALDAELKKIESINGVNGAILMQYLRTQTLNKEQIDKAKEYIDLENKLYVTTLDARGRATTVIDENVKKQMGTYSKETVNFSNLVKRVGTISDKNMDAVIQKYGELSDVTHEYNQSVEKVITTGNRLSAKNQDVTSQTKASTNAIEGHIDQIRKIGAAAAAEYDKVIQKQNQIKGFSNEEIDKIDKTEEPGLGNLSGGNVAKSTTPTEDFTPENLPTTPTPDAANIKYTGEDLSADAEAWNQKISIAADAMSKIDNIVNMSYQNRIAQIDNEIAADEAAKEKELKAAGGNTAKIQEINKRYDAKEKEREKEKRRIQKEQAKYQKTSALIGATINTALAVTSALSQPTPTLLNIVLAAIALAAGIAEVALIASQPLPSYRKGRKGGPAEMAKVHAGEAIRYPGGEMVLTPDQPETLAYLPKGTDVIPHEELLNMAGQAATFLPNYGNQENSRLENEIRGLHSGFAMLNRTVKDKRENYIEITESGLRKITREGNTWVEWINEKVMP